VHRFHIAVIASLVLGAIAGVLLNESAAGYWAVAAIATLGGIAGGSEEDGLRAGALRGLWSGALYGLGLVVLSTIVGGSREVDTTDPFVVLIVVTAIAGAILGAIGGMIKNPRAATQQQQR
jgi:hypothetical protein